MPSNSPSSKSSSFRRKKALGLPAAWPAPITCQFCLGQDFRRSRLRNDDISKLLLLNYPVRCLRCGERQYVSLVVAALSISSSKRQPRPSTRRPSARETSWNEPEERMVLHSRKEDPPSSLR